VVLPLLLLEDMLVWIWALHRPPLEDMPVWIWALHPPLLKHLLLPQLQLPLEVTPE
jgi:hypothetical protein